MLAFQSLLCRSPADIHGADVFVPIPRNLEALTGEHGMTQWIAPSCSCAEGHEETTASVFQFFFVYFFFSNNDSSKNKDIFS